MASQSTEAPVRLAVFDFDGTVIDGSSTVRLVRKLIWTHRLHVPTAALIGLWGLCYKLRLPQNESWVREKLFKAFEGKPKEQVDEFLRDYTDECCQPIVRDGALRAMGERKAEGCVNIIVSASFDPIVGRFIVERPIDYQVSTHMKVDSNGCYMREVDGLPIEGDQKVVALKEFADAEFGPGNWHVEYAYGDHHSDEALLREADHPVAVNPDNALERHAKKLGWRIVEW